MLIRLMESIDLAPDSISIPGYRVTLSPSPSALTLKLVSSASPHGSLALFELLPFCWSLEQMSEFVHKLVYALAL